MVVGTKQVKTTFVNTSNMHLVVGGAREVLFASLGEGECISFINKCTEEQADTFGVIKIMTPNEEWTKNYTIDVNYKTPKEIAAEAAEEAAKQAKIEEMGGEVDYMMADMDGTLDKK